MCGCVCDDLTATIAGDRIASIQNACGLSEDWFLTQNARTSSHRERGEPVSYSEAIARASRILSESRFPLIYGLSHSSTPGQRAAVALADRLGGVVDTSASTCHAPSIMALQAVGESTCTLGEVRNRSDLVIFWGSNPVYSHPRHLERYSGSATGLHIPRGRADRTLVVVDTVRTESAEEADLFLQVEPGSDFAILWALRGLIAGLPLCRESVGGVPAEVLVDLARRMTSCRFGAFFFGLGLTRGSVPSHPVEALLRLVADLNQHTRFIARRMRHYGDVAGADSVLCWQTGYPFSVSLSRGYPRYNPGEFSAVDLLERGEPDACVIVGHDGFNKLPPAALAHLRSIPTIALLDDRAEPLLDADVQFATSVYGIHHRGTAYRMDEVPIPLPQLLTSSLPSDEQVLRALLAGLGTEMLGNSVPSGLTR